MSGLANYNSLKLARTREERPRYLEEVWKRRISGDSAISATEWDITAFFRVSLFKNCASRQCAQHQPSAHEDNLPPVMIRTGPLSGLGKAVCPAIVNNSPTVTGCPDRKATSNNAGSKAPGEKKLVCTADGSEAARYPFG